MGQSVPVLQRYNSKSKVISVSVNSNGDLMAFAEVNRVQFIEGNSHPFEGITGIKFLNDDQLIIAHGNGISSINNDKIVWTHDVETGAENLNTNGQYIVFADSLGRGHVISSNGDLIFQPNFQSILHLSPGPQLAIANEDGHVSTWSWDGQKLWERPQRGEVGERITALGWNNEALIVAREGHGLVPGDEEAIEIECWKYETLLERSEPKGRVIAIDGLWQGLDMGGIQYYNEIIAEINHPVKLIIDGGERALAASWFHLHCVSNETLLWSVEHQGMVEHVAANKDWSVVLIAGEDQNDWTENEPVILIDANAEPTDITVTEGAIKDWGEAAPLNIKAEDLYDSEDAAFEELMKQEPPKKDINEDMISLLDALDDELFVKPDQNNFVEEEAEEDPSNLLNIDLDLMAELNTDIDEIIQPVADSGNDISKTAKKDGFATVVLDGTASYDPQKRIINWQWIDETGREIANSPKVKVKIGVGVHRFDLRITDQDGSWSTDALTVTIE